MNSSEGLEKESGDALAEPLPVRAKLCKSLGEQVRLAAVSELQHRCV